MESLKELYRIGKGPSSSHTMGPNNGAKYFKKKYPDADKYSVTLQGSLAKTGKGHLTDEAVVSAFAPTECKVIWDTESPTPVHPNTIEFTAFCGDTVHGIHSITDIVHHGGGIAFHRLQKSIHGTDLLIQDTSFV